MSRSDPSPGASAVTRPLTAEMWGNFPRRYAMVGQIHGATPLSAPWDTVL